jgi:hypothetical protein
MDLLQIEREICTESVATGQGLIAGFLNTAMNFRILC